MEKISETMLKIEGMACDVCRGKAQKALEGVAGVTKVNVDLDTKQAVVSGTASRDELVKAVEEIGFTVVA
jgi:copper chaperone